MTQHWTWASSELRVGHTTLDRVVGVICLLAFACMAWTCSQFHKPLNSEDIGPGAFPVGIAMLGMLFALMLTVRRLAAPAEPTVAIGRPHVVLLTALVLTTYVCVLSHLGFYACTLVAIPLLMLVGGERRWLVLLLNSLGFALFVYLCFDRALGVVFP